MAGGSTHSGFAVWVSPSPVIPPPVATVSQRLIRGLLCNISCWYFRTWSSVARAAGWGSGEGREGEVGPARAYDSSAVSSVVCLAVSSPSSAS